MSKRCERLFARLCKEFGEEAVLVFLDRLFNIGCVNRVREEQQPRVIGVCKHALHNRLDIVRVIGVNQRVENRRVGYNAEKIIDRVLAAVSDYLINAAALCIALVAEVACQRSSVAAGEHSLNVSTGEELPFPGSYGAYGIFV